MTGRAPGPPPAAPETAAPAHDPRDGTDGAHPRRLRALLVGVGAAGTLAVLTALLQLDGGVAQLGPAFWLLCGLLLLTEARPLFTAGTRDPVGLVLSTTFVFAVLLRYGLPAALVLQALSTLLADVLARKAPLRTWFNVGQYALSWTAAAGVLHLLGHRASLDRPLDLTSGDLLAVAFGGLTYFLVNELLVDAAISALTGRGLLAVAREDLGFEVLTTVALLALSPLVCLAVERGAAFVPLLLPPLLAVYAVAAVALARERAALTDALTGLPNRSALAERAAAALAEGPAALVLLDLDRFKEVNDTLGHHVGDRLLQVVAQRLSTGVRGCDTVARLGGDEFALLLPGLDSAGPAVEAVERLCAAVAAPVALEGLPLEVGATAGIALAPVHGGGLEDLLRRADVAMYAGKASHQVEVYDPARDQHSPDRLALAGELRRALQGEDVAVRYQPVLDLADGGVRRVQAVVHWHHPVRGPVPPEEVVALAARAGLAPALTARVLDLALGQLADWDRQGRPLQVAVEAGAGLTGPAAAEQVGELLRR